jgi:phosphoribosylformimino-5-aminoimidazole carboxamide ribotide isomerase
MSTFTVFPAIDLREGSVVRLRQGDPGRQTTYSLDPAETARRWCKAGARWLHIVDLDGAFGNSSAANQLALEAILASGASVQFGGGLRSMEQIQRALDLGVQRAILGTVAIEDPSLLSRAVAQFGPEHIAVAIDVYGNRVRTRGWTSEAESSPIDLGIRLHAAGVLTIILTDISRDGMQGGLNLPMTRKLAVETGLDVIASGGVSSLEDVSRVHAAGLYGVVIGRALYDGQISLEEALKC